MSRQHVEITDGKEYPIELAAVKSARLPWARRWEPSERGPQPRPLFA